jgi:hypothetical protein
MQLSEVTALHDSGFRRVCLCHCLIASDGDERVQRGLAPLDAFERAAYDLDRRDRAFPDLSCQLGG